MTGRQCGSCSLCCKLFDVPELDSPANSWCKHCRPGRGCAIHAERPNVCRAFHCQWILDPMFGPEWKPDRSKLVVTFVADPDRVTGKMFKINITVDPGFPTAWRKPPFYGRIKDLSRAANVVVTIGQRCFHVFPEKEIEFMKGEAVIVTPGGMCTVMAASEAKERYPHEARPGLRTE